MPPPSKGEAAKKAPKLTPAELLRSEAMAIVPELIGEAFDGAIEALEERRLASAVTGHAAQGLREAIMRTLELFDIHADPGETDLLDETWTAGSESEPVSNDTWSREMLALLGPAARPGSRQPRTSRRSLASAHQPEETDLRPASADWSAQAKRFNAPVPSKGEAGPKVNVKELDLEARTVPPRSLADAERNLLPKTRLDRKLVREQQDEAKRVRAMRAELGGKDYAYLGDQKTLLTTPVSRPELLPNLAASTAARISETTVLRDTMDYGTQPPGTVGSQRGSRPKSPGMGLPRAKQSGVLGGLPADQPPTPIGQPPLLETISGLSKGVRVTENGGEKFGGVLPLEEGAVSLRMYRSMAGAASGVAAGKADGGAGGGEPAAVGEAKAASGQPPRPESKGSSRQAAGPPAAQAAAQATAQPAAQPKTAAQPAAQPTRGSAGASAKQRPLSPGGAGFQQTTGPLREDWPDTAEFRGLQSRQRGPVAAQSPSQRGRREQSPPHRRNLALGQSWSANSGPRAAATSLSPVLARAKPQAAQAGPKVQIHSSVRHGDLLQ